MNYFVSIYIIIWARLFFQFFTLLAQKFFWRLTHRNGTTRQYHQHHRSMPKKTNNNNKKPQPKAAGATREELDPDKLFEHSISIDPSIYQTHITLKVFGDLELKNLRAYFEVTKVFTPTQRQHLNELRESRQTPIPKVYFETQHPIVVEHGLLEGVNYEGIVLPDPDETATDTSPDNGSSEEEAKETTTVSIPKANKAKRSVEELVAEATPKGNKRSKKKGSETKPSSKETSEEETRKPAAVEKPKVEVKKEKVQESKKPEPPATPREPTEVVDLTDDKEEEVVQAVGTSPKPKVEDVKVEVTVQEAINQEPIPEPVEVEQQEPVEVEKKQPEESAESKRSKIAAAALARFEKLKKGEVESVVEKEERASEEENKSE